MQGNERGKEVQGDTGNCRAIIVLGMHRSGTSCLTGSLQRRGLHLGEVQERNPHNPKGNRESRRIMHLNDAVLSHSGGAWNRPPRAVSWSREQAAERDEVIASLQAGERPWGFKDPRTLLVLPFWLDAIPGASFVGAYRDPVQVARSLYRRSGMAHGEAYALWLEYNRRLLDLHRVRPFPLVSFDLDDASYAGEVDRAASQLGLDRLCQPGGDFFEPDLRGSADHTEALPDPPAALVEVHAALDARREGKHA